MTDNAENTITLIIDIHDHGDVSFRDAESSKIFLNVYKTLFQDEVQDIVDFNVPSNIKGWESWLDDDRLGAGVTYTLRFHITRKETEAVVEILEGLYNVEIIYI